MTSIYPRTNYEMSEEDLAAILQACRPVPCIMVGGYTPSSQQENANRAWEALGVKMGFDYMTVRPSPEKGQRFFTAIPSETAAQREERLAREKKEARQTQIQAIEAEISELQRRLNALKSDE